MKKGLLFSLLFVFTLSACGGNSSSSESSEGATISTSITPVGGGTTLEEMNELVTDAFEVLNEICNEALDITDNEAFIWSINDYKDEVTGYLLSIDNLEDAEGAVDYVYEHQESYVENYFKSEAFNEVYDYINGIINSTERFEIQTGVFEIFNYHYQEWEDLENNFISVIGLANQITYETKQFLRDNNSHIDDKFGYLADEVYGYAMGLVDAYFEYLDADVIVEYAGEKIEEFIGVEDEETAIQIANRLKSELYSYILDSYKNGICGAYQNFVNDLFDNMSNEEIKEKVSIWIVNDKEVIHEANDFAGALKAYEDSLDVMIREVDSMLHSWGDDAVDEVFTRYWYTLNDTEYGDAFLLKYMVCESLIERLSCDIMDLEREIMAILDELDQYGQELVAKL